MLNDVTLVIPVGAEETGWQSLLADLQRLPPNAEVRFVAVEHEPSDLAERAAALGLRCAVRWDRSGQGRARQQNIGAAMSERSFLWFLHADSRVGPEAFDALERALLGSPAAIHYFDLAFQDDGPFMVTLNAWGANVRSRYLRLPFGDQGFCISKAAFERLGRFDEQAPYGEDHLLIWKAHRFGVPVQPVGTSITTSSRKYSKHGWHRTTLVHLWRTVRQAIPQLALTFGNRTDS